MSDFLEHGAFPLYLTFDDVLLLPKYSEIMPSDTSLEVDVGRLSLKIPVLSAPMDTVTEKEMALAIGREGGAGIIHRNLSIAAQAAEVKAVREAGGSAGAAVGVGADLHQRLDALAVEGPAFLCVDSAHGYTKNVLEAVKYIKSRYASIPLIAGNVATYDGAKALFIAGADAVKVGMGPGSICTTRIMSGMGVPQLSAIMACAVAAREFGRPIIADGGIKTSGDMVKALAAGAAAVMLGSLLAGCEESPGEMVEQNGRRCKTYRGMGSVKAMALGSAARYGQSCQEGTKKLVAEGVEGLVSYRGALKDHLHQLMGGIKAGMAYLGARTISELQQKAQFIRITPAGMAESHPHSLLTHF
jgi:IMP dehydrogenase